MDALLRAAMLRFPVGLALLRAAGICGASVVTWEFPSTRLRTVAWISGFTTVHESITDSTILVEPDSISSVRTDGRCASARWIGTSIGADLEVGTTTHLLVPFGLCGEYLEPDRAPTRTPSACPPRPFEDDCETEW